MNPRERQAVRERLRGHPALRSWEEKERDADAEAQAALDRALVEYHNDRPWLGGWRGERRPDLGRAEWDAVCNMCGFRIAAEDHDDGLSAHYHHRRECRLPPDHRTYREDTIVCWLPPSHPTQRSAA